MQIRNYFRNNTLHFCNLCLTFLLCSVATLQLWAEPTSVRFDRQVRPILSDNCFQCHGPDEQTREAELRLDTKEGLFGDRGGYHVVVPESPENSELYQRIASNDPFMVMPPSDSEHELTSEQIALIRRWIEEGARWQRHWAFVAPTRPPVPKTKQDQWPQNAIDRFILAELETHDLQPSEPAEKRTLIRRVTFDLTGLPPSVRELEEFLADDSPKAYEKVVDRLLNSPHYGEHMARYWLDVARYGDTHGLHVDNYREIWPYRDWVIQAFNGNMPYDQFLIEQLGGDLLPKATLEQRIASGFNRCHVTTNEGGSIAEEVYVRNVIDRVSTMGSAMLGMTLGCAVCHDHKFDPVTQKDFFQLFAFFNSMDGPEMDGNTPHPAPYVRVPSDEQAAQLEKLRQQIASLDQQREQRVRDSHEEFAKWLETQGRQTSTARLITPLNVSEELLAHYDMQEHQGNQLENLADSGAPGTLHGKPSRIKSPSGSAIQFSEDSYAELGKWGDFDHNMSFSFGAWVRVPPNSSGTLIAKVDHKDLDQGYHLSVDGGRLIAQLAKRWPGYAIKLETQEKVLSADTWHHVFVTYDGSGYSQGVTIYLDGEVQQTTILCDSLHMEGSLGNDKPLQLGRLDQEASYVGAALGDVRFYDRCLLDAEVRAIQLYSELHPPLRSQEQLTAAELEKLQELFVLSTDTIHQQLTREIATLHEQLDELTNQIPTTLVFRETDQPREAFVLLRGQYDQHGEQVIRETPAALPPMPSELPKNRLGLARWLVSAEHPLTSRVAVNRFWQQFFGRGIVETSEDFGSQGSPPTHPELLDWLAVEFQESGWDVKSLVKQIVMSSSYRQTSSMSPELAKRDPENRLLARGPRFRLDAELVRDQALVVSGLWHDRIGGPSVKPPQPAGLWKAVGFSESNTAEFVADKGADKIYRRSLYTFWKRNTQQTKMSIFDAPSRESCTMRRERTNSPLQALVLMNDPQFVEASRHFAQRILKECEGPPRQKIAWAYEQVTLRPPDAFELEELASAFADFLSNYESHPEAAENILNVGPSQPDEALEKSKLAAWTMLANLLLNLDEVITKE